MFAQSEDDSWKKNITCHNCGKKGHLVTEFKSKGDSKKPKSQEKANQLHANVKETDDDDDDDGNLFVQQRNSKRGLVDKNYIFLDNQSTVNQITNLNLLKNIRKGERSITVHCNAESTKTNRIGELGNLTVYRNPNSIANVLSLKFDNESSCDLQKQQPQRGIPSAHPRWYEQILAK